MELLHRCGHEQIDIQKGAIDRLGTSKLVTSNRYLTSGSLIVISYCNMWNTLGRHVARGCSPFPDVHKGLILHAILFSMTKARKQGNIRRQKWVDFVKQRRAKGAYTKFLYLFETLYSRRRYSSLQLRWRSSKQGIHVKAYMWWNRNNCCAISPCWSGDKNTSGHWKCKALSWTGD